MDEISRELVAYAIVGVLLIVSVPWIAVTLRRRHRERRRRRGIKRYGH